MAFAGLGVLLATNVLTLEDINLQGSTLATFLWLAVLFALSGQLNELGFMGYVGGRLTALLGGVAWSASARPCAVWLRQDRMGWCAIRSTSPISSRTSASPVPNGIVAPSC